MVIYKIRAMEIRCKHCGDYFSPSPETQELIAEGYISRTSVDTCDECWELIEYSEADYSESFSDAYPGPITINFQPAGQPIGVSNHIVKLKSIKSTSYVKLEYV